MSIENAREYLKKFNLDSKIMEFTESSATVELAARALGTKPERIAKTLSFLLFGKPILIVVAGDMKIDNHKYKEAFSQKAKMLDADEVSSLIGHEVGGVCPFGIKSGVDVYLDVSLKRFETVFPACGSSNSAIELTPEKLDEITDNKGWIDVAKGMQ